MAKDVIIACDFPSGKATTDFLKCFTEEKPYVKIGMELFYAEGPQILKEIRSMGHKIFLDLKLHDIPNTVKSAMSVLARYDIDIINIHAAGGSEMMKGAVEAFANLNKKPLIIAVTQLTSTDDKMLKEELLINETMQDTVLKYAKNAADSGLDGVVCSPHEAEAVKRVCGENFVTVTPGIRFEDNTSDDQKRIMTPKLAREAKCDYIVVGRPITKADDPNKAYKKCINDFLNK